MPGYNIGADHNSWSVPFLLTLFEKYEALPSIFLEPPLAHIPRSGGGEVAQCE